ncbi:MAG: DUF350 domain-containing protein [Chloroflexi bacterium]|nr:DUF350 domain-containing protein [Chloroflexota bacterium]
MELGREITLLLLTTVYAVLGIVLLAVAYRVFDMFTPMNLGKIIFEEGNVAAAVAVGLYLVALAIIISAAIHG